MVRSVPVTFVYISRACQMHTTDQSQIPETYFKLAPRRLFDLEGLFRVGIRFYLTYKQISNYLIGELFLRTYSLLGQ